METTKKNHQLHVSPEVASIFENLAEFIDDYTKPDHLAGALDDVLWLYEQAIAKYPEDLFAENRHVDNIWMVKELIRVLRGGDFPISESKVYSNGDFADALVIMNKYLKEGAQRHKGDGTEQLTDKN